VQESEQVNESQSKVQEPTPRLSWQSKCTWWTSMNGQSTTLILPIISTTTTMMMERQYERYRKTSDRRRAPHTGRGSDSFVPIEAGSRIQAGG